MNDNSTDTGSIQDIVQDIETRLGSRLDAIELADVIVGLFCAGARLSTGRAGVAFTPRADIAEAVCCADAEIRRATGQENPGFLTHSYDNKVLKSALAIAVINALSHCVWDERGLDGYDIVPEKDAIEEIEFAHAKAITLVGAFVPFVLN